MNTAIEMFLTRLKKGPAVLFLGQRVLKLDTGKDYLLEEIMRKYGEPNEARSGTYFDILTSRVSEDIEAALLWMQGRCERMLTPEWLGTVSDYPWSALYTSAIDSVCLSAFRNDWRELHSIFSPKDKRVHVRDRIQMHSTFLFGNINMIEEYKRPPLDDLEWDSREHEAVQMAARLGEDVTPLGHLIIEAYAGENDWFKPSILYAIVSKLASKQAFMFSVNESIRKNRHIQQLEKTGKLMLFEQSLAECLEYGAEMGLISMYSDEERDYEHAVTVGRNTIEIPMDVRNRIHGTATILDDRVMAPPPYIFEDTKYDEFRHFLLESSFKTNWTAYGRGYPFRRLYENRLYDETKRALDERLYSLPIILHGATGTGKTVALCALAYRIRKEEQYPVLYIDNHMEQVDFKAIDYVCQYFEREKVPCTLIVWDGMGELEDYYALCNYLGNRGRKAVLVGSCYYISERSKEELSKMKVPRKKRGAYIEAPTGIKEDELTSFYEHLKSIDSRLNMLLERDAKSYRIYDDTFLVALYHLLPETKSILASLLTNEVTYSEEHLTKKFKDDLIVPENSLAYALKLARNRSGKSLDELYFSPFNSTEVDGEQVSSVQKLMQLVMIIGRFGKDIPLDLLLRTLHQVPVTNFVDLLNDIDIIHWYEDKRGQITIGPRHYFEAKLYSKRRHGRQKLGVELVRELILHIKDEPSEVEFSVELLKNMGPNGLEGNSYLDFYPELSETVKQVRTESSITNPRLMLQEAVLLREYVKQKSMAKVIDSKMALHYLNEAVSTLNEALNNTSDKHDRIRPHIMVDLATAYSSRIIHLLEIGSIEEAKIDYDRASILTDNARQLDAGMYHALDVLFWSSIEMLKMLDPVKDKERILNIETDIMHVFNTTSIDDFPPSQHDNYMRNKDKFAEIFNNQQMSDEVFAALEAKGSCTGYYLIASRLASFVLNKDEPWSQAKQEACERAIVYLEDNREKIVNDNRCLTLLLHLWWRSKTNKTIFAEEFQTVKFEAQDWRYLSRLTDLIIENGYQVHSTIIYLAAIAAFHLKEYIKSEGLFRRLSGQTDFSHRRLSKTYLASKESGAPQEFYGSVGGYLRQDDTKGELKVEGLPIHITIIASDFGKSQLERGEHFSRFLIGFNFIGPIAVPASRYKSGKE